jgi:hypothetical protein
MAAPMILGARLRLKIAHASAGVFTSAVRNTRAPMAEA